MAGTTRLKLYNNALAFCGERRLASLTEDREPRRLLDDVWDDNGVNYCLEQGDWQFALRAQQINYDPSTVPPFGYQRAFNKPTDWISTQAVASDPYYREPMNDRQYTDEVDFWFADLDTIYVKYISNAANYGSDLSKWPQSFVEYAEAFFASKVIMRLTGDKQKIQFLLGAPGKTDGGELGRRLKVAKNRAAMTKGTRVPAESQWNRARRGRTRGPMGDGGTTGSLIG